MRALFAAASVLLLSAVSATPISAQQIRSYHCIATYVVPGSTHITVYVSQLIPMEAGQQAALRGSWATFIKANYHLETISTAVCQPLGANPEMQEQYLTMQENAWKNRGWEVVRVTWKPGQSASSSSAASIYSAAPAPAGLGAPPAPSAAPPPSSQERAPRSTVSRAWENSTEPRASYCFSDDRNPTIYFSDAFDTAGLPSSSAWSTAFSKLLAEKYGYKGTVTCKNSNTIVNAQSLIRNQQEVLQGKQIVETDWTYEPPAPGEAPAAPVVAATATPAPAVAHAAHSSHSAAAAPSSSSAQITTSHALAQPPSPPPAPTANSPAPQGQNLSADQLKEPFRTQALNEVNSSKSYCQTNAVLPGLFDCDCFAKMILNYRIAHASEYHVSQGGHDTGGWEPFVNLFYSEKLPCTECLSDARLTKYATDEGRRSLANVIAQKGASAPSVTNTIDCEAKRFVANFRAKPYIGLAQGALNQAADSCWKEHAQD